MIKLRRPKRERPALDLTPLIDVVFILLIFFMLTAVVIPKGLSVTLPQAQSLEVSKDTKTTLTLQADQSLHLNGTPINLEQLSFYLSRLDPSQSIILEGDQQVDYGFFVRVVDTIRQAGSHRLVLAAQAPGKGL